MMIAAAAPFSPAAATMPGTDCGGAAITSRSGASGRFLNGFDRLDAFDLGVARVDETDRSLRMPPREDFSARRDPAMFRAGLHPRPPPTAAKTACRDDRSTSAGSIQTQCNSSQRPVIAAELWHSPYCTGSRLARPRGCGLVRLRRVRPNAAMKRSASGDSVLPYGNDTGSFGSNSNQQTSDSHSRRRATIVGSRKAAERSIIFITEQPSPVR